MTVALYKAYTPKTVCQFLPYTYRKCQSQTPGWIFVFSFPLLLLGGFFLLLIHLFCSCSVKSPSVLPAPLSLSFAVECASQQYLMKEWLTGCCHACVCVFMFHVRTCSLPEGDGIHWLSAGRKRSRHIWIVGITHSNFGWPLR